MLRLLPPLALQLLRQREEELEQVRREAEEARLKHHREAGEERQHTLREKHLAEEAVLQRDFPIIQGVAIFISAIFVFINIIVDLAASYIDPRLEY